MTFSDVRKILIGQLRFTPQDIWDMTMVEIRLAIAGHQEQLYEDRINVWKSMRRQTAILVNTVRGLVDSKAKTIYDTDIISLTGDEETTAQIQSDRSRTQLTDEQIKAMLDKWQAAGLFAQKN